MLHSIYRCVQSETTGSATGSRISDSESRVILTNPKLKIQDGELYTVYYTDSSVIQRTTVQV